ncbi:cation:proton antiporter [Anaerorhabdus furcosa]|uniref:NhaP-type Na+/H+ or K+/H+ antiporter n=1 Tax=Anaerorhabdus furcosa TaxID=118967 RepID=A0A1T4KEW0_9FIRM|nr:cation:proton antiporter [Anaerorhabdus furcosa]SJZ40916.1 NhaP-type Na+/H+ or K+/H+ antiporter [Anaerorhabdus furcosa]
MLVSIGLICIVGLLCAGIFNKLKLPGLIGMILAGIILGNSGLHLLDNKLMDISSEIRQIALIIILTRAGLTLKLDDFKKIGRPAVFMSFVPALFEITACTIIAPIFLPLTTLEAMLLGCVLAAVSPAVIVPSMIKLIQSGKGEDKKIPQLILTGASFDDVVVISLFTVVSTFLLSGVVNFTSVLQVPVSIILGILVGLSWGYVLQIYFKKFHMRDSVKMILILSFSFMFVGFEKNINTIIPFSSLICVMTMAISMNIFYPTLANRLSSKYNKLWVAGEIFLFVLVGASVNLSLAFKGGISLVIVILLCLVVRSVGVFVSLIKTELNSKEKIFCAIAYIPKATVQAAIGGLPLAMGLASGDIILTGAVVAILVSAPLGAILIEKSANKLLN